ncbi:triple tyrosine motif-containing protein [Marinoscillum sp. 108]|uniref:helix-turn-helix and ligand-binding sensor domain-containing protein n=1 Tax=Marinoscillum sp. 108 TaxID=2653151 RepID=UPI0012F01284|nr:triple tyrosine motif-containing protein [Marinoscillum sp. 108]VXD11545.1 putative ABC transporter substrate-binding protein [Marinoscillum sp. 108]
MLLWGLICGQIAYGQIGNKGVPNIRNFTYDEYQAGAQNWSILQDDQGRMLFGNNYGLLEYNGRDWSLITQPTNKTVVWSIYKGRDSTIYIGAQNEFGYLKINNAGQKRYISLLSKVPEDSREFSDIWAILETSSGIHFHARGAVYIYKDDTINVIKTPMIDGFSKIGDSILVQDRSFNIYVVKPTGLRKVISGADVQGTVLRIFDNHHGGLQLVTQDHGILTFENGKIVPEKHISSAFMQGHKIQCLYKLRNDYLAVGTVGAGLLILDDAFRPIQWLNKSNGLQSNTILAIGSDHIGNLWVATETGIDYVQTAIPLYKIADNYELEGTVSSTLIHNDKLYVGTNSGVFYTEWNDQENPLTPTLHFKQIKGLSGQVWNLHLIDGQIYVCQHEGLYRIEGSSAIRIFEGTGVWNLIPIREGNPKYYLQGAYDGIHLFELSDGDFRYLRKIEGFEETSRIIELDDKNNIWMAHGYKGIYRLRLDQAMKRFAEVKLYKKEHGFPTSLFVNLFKVKNQVLFGTERGTYQYDYALDTMVADPLYTRILGNTQHIRLLKEDDGKIWYIKGQDMHDEMGIIDFYDNEKYEVTKAPLQHLQGRFNPGFENINSLSQNAVLFGTKNGIVLFDRTVNRNYAKPYLASITEVRCVTNDSLLYGQLPIDQQKPISDHVDPPLLRYDQNAIRFYYASDYFESPDQTSYSYYLEGFDKSWFTGEHELSKTYTNLPAGEYIFRVKATNVYGFESKEAHYSFKVLPPWYLTTMAKVAYVITFLLIGVGLMKLYRKRIENAQKKERLAQMDVLQRNREEYNAEKLLTEQELITLKNEKLEAEIAISRSKMDVLNAEMAASIMMITQKNGVLIKVREDLESLLKKAKDSNKELIQRVIKHINQDIDTDQDWRQFKIHFDKVHEDFLERLKCQFPDITPKDLQLAAYLRLNLSSKEIASMMNITIRSIEGCRYRLRKHLNLSSETNLSEFIIKF